MEWCYMGNRLSSLDILRGLTIAIMILVNFQPDESVAYTILVHKPWEGITLADVAFPSFVFIMGASMALSKSGFQYGWQWRLLKRVLILFVVGLIYNHCGGIFALMFVQGFGTNELYDMWITHGRLMGVLQRLALSYGFAMLIFYFLQTVFKEFKIFPDIRHFKISIILLAKLTHFIFGKPDISAEIMGIDHCEFLKIRYC